MGALTERLMTLLQFNIQNDFRGTPKFLQL